MTPGSRLLASWLSQPVLSPRLYLLPPLLLLGLLGRLLPFQPLLLMMWVLLLELPVLALLQLLLQLLLLPLVLLRLGLPLLPPLLMLLLLVVVLPVHLSNRLPAVLIHAQRPWQLPSVVPGRALLAMVEGPLLIALARRHPPPSWRWSWAGEAALLPQRPPCHAVQRQAAWLQPRVQEELRPVPRLVPALEGGNVLQPQPRRSQMISARPSQRPQSEPWRATAATQHKAIPNLPHRIIRGNVSDGVPKTRAVGVAKADALALHVVLRVLSSGQTSKPCVSTRRQAATDT